MKAASAADAAALNPNSIKTLLPDGLSTFVVKGNLVFSNGYKNKNLKILLIVLFYAIKFLIIIY